MACCGMYHATFAQVAQVIGAQADGYMVTRAAVDADHFVTLRDTAQGVKITLIKDGHTGKGADNTRVACIVIPHGATADAIAGRYSELVKMA